MKKLVRIVARTILYLLMMAAGSTVIFGPFLLAVSYHPYLLLIYVLYMALGTAISHEMDS